MTYHRPDHPDLIPPLVPAVFHGGRMQPLIDAPCPRFPDLAPWRTLESGELAAILGVTTQVLSNWRFRGLGPKAEPRRPGSPNRTHYKIGEVWSWLARQAGYQVEPWRYDRRYLCDLYRYETAELNPSNMEDTIRILEAKDPKMFEEWMAEYPNLLMV